ncbi:hypothetical protein KEM55_006906 [Ascosphaera atra]|nr:hypothetical protein KEM55_006906 [Ascosphaera atra]
MRSSKSLNEVAASVLERQSSKFHLKREGTPDEDETGIRGGIPFEDELTGKMNQLKLDGSVKLIGGTSNLLFLPSGLEMDSDEQEYAIDSEDDFNDPVTRWTNATNDRELILHLLKLYFTWHYGYFTALSKKRFERDFYRGRLSEYCSPLLVNTMLAIGSHFSSWPAARENPKDSATAGDHFFREAKRLILENNEYERSRLCTVQALALMSVREAGCGREGSGWVYSGMSFRMALDLGLNVDPNELGPNNFSEEELDARRITFWGCFLFDKYWSNYLGRQPQLSGTNITVPIFDIDPEEENAPWVPYTDSGMALEGLEQPARSRTISRQIIHLCEISNDLLSNFYRPSAYERNMGKHEEFRNLHRIHAKLEAWKRDLPEELQVKNTLLPQALLMQ